MRGYISIVFCITTLVWSYAEAVSTNKTSFDVGYSNFVSSSEPYFGDQYNATSLSTYGLGYQLHNQKTGERKKIDAQTFYSFGEDEVYINPSEVYWDFGSEDEELVLGRKKYKWSEADEIWNTGLWQPQFRWNRLRPENQGLVGGFYKSKIKKSLSLTAFVSPIFIPDTGVTFREKNGKIESQNPWFRPPPETTNLFDTETEVFATIEVPDASEVVVNPGLGFRLDGEINDQQSWGAAYAHKPVNQIMNAFNYQLRTTDVGGGVDLTFYPWVAYHNLYTGDWKYQDRKYSHLVSATYEDPTRLFEDPNLNYQRLEESFIVSWITRWNMSGEGETATQLYGGYMRYWGGSATDGGDPVSEGTQFELRPRFVSVGKLGIRYPVWMKSGKLYGSLEGNYDVLMKGGTVLTKAEFVFNSGWAIAANMDLIGVIEDQGEGFYKNSFVNTYRANDVVQLGMSYVF